VPRVLVADDDADIRELVLFKLESPGFEVAAVADR
jgi:CheY-like chemotaxis protein